MEDSVLVFCYTRAQALEDGVLIAVDEGLARESGFKWPLALTAEAWASCVSVPSDDSCQSEVGRLWDVLTVLHFTVKMQQLTRKEHDRVDFRVIVQNGERKEWVKLKAICGPGDDGSPVITIMLPDQD